jgi:hypothetical protein
VQKKYHLHVRKLFFTSGKKLHTLIWERGGTDKPSNGEKNDGGLEDFIRNYRQLPR